MAIDEAMKAHQLKTGPIGTAIQSGAIFGFIESASNQGPCVGPPSAARCKSGDRWPVPVTILHTARPGPCITVLGGIPGMN